MRALARVEGHNLRRKRENEEGEHCPKGMFVRRGEFRFELKGMNKKGTKGYKKRLCVKESRAEVGRNMPSDFFYRTHGFVQE
jgi:hypothetical protein